MLNLLKHKPGFRGLKRFEPDRTVRSFCIKTGGSWIPDQALPAFEETATVFYLDLDDLLRRPTPYETR